MEFPDDKDAPEVVKPAITHAASSDTKPKPRSTRSNAPRHGRHGRH